MKTSLSLVGLIALSGFALLACDGGDPPVPVDGTGGTAPGTGGAPGGTGGVAPGTGGGDPGTGGAATSNALFTGTGTWIDGTTNLAGVQGAFYILEDSVKNDDPVEDTLMHTDLDAVTGGTDVDGVSKFDDLTEKPCVTGTIAQVTDSTGVTPPLCDASAAETEAGSCQWSAQWGGGIGLNMNETGGDASMKSVWNALTANAGAPVVGFKFTASGSGGGATLRFKAKNPDSEEDFCKAFTIVPGTPVDVKLSDLKHQCWGSAGTEFLDLENIESLQWQIVSSEKMGYTVTDFCIESLEWY